jgi:transcriptional regulator with XRE-family HTH domain
MQHELNCFTCGKDDRGLIYCSFCPKAYHPDCLPPGTKLSKPRWGCPSHKCQVCGAATSKSRGKIYRCVHCPGAYCFAHVPTHSAILKGNPYESIGYLPTSFVFIVCKICRDPSEVEQEVAQEAQIEHSSAEDDDSCQEPPRKRRKIIAADKETRILQYVRTCPNDQLVEQVREALKVVNKLQKDLAQDIDVSQGILSQYMNGGTRSNGWASLELKLKAWLDAFKAHHGAVPAPEVCCKQTHHSSSPAQPVVKKEDALVDVVYHCSTAVAAQTNNGAPAREYDNFVEELHELKQQAEHYHVATNGEYLHKQKEVVHAVRPLASFGDEYPYMQYNAQPVYEENNMMAQYEEKFTQLQPLMSTSYSSHQPQLINKYYVPRGHTNTTNYQSNFDFEPFSALDCAPDRDLFKLGSYNNAAPTLVFPN